jgi:hypothetical protein
MEEVHRGHLGVAEPHGAKATLDNLQHQFED